jgi:hypothetical protein
MLTVDWSCCEENALFLPWPGALFMVERGTGVLHTPPLADPLAQVADGQLESS